MRPCLELGLTGSSILEQDVCVPCWVLSAASAAVGEVEDVVFFVEEGGELGYWDWGSEGSRGGC